MVYDDNDLIPISALQHYVFCPRQCALIHIEQQWVESVLTAEGRLLHERAHEGGQERRGDIRTVRGLRLRSLTLGLIGQADVVEFRYDSDSLVVVPIEYKRGTVKPDRSDEVQVCAQALCLEEMLGTTISFAEIFYGKVRRRHGFAVTADLRKKTVETIQALRRMLELQATPRAVREPKCDSCSLFRVCLPDVTGSPSDVTEYLTSWRKSV